MKKPIPFFPDFRPKNRILYRWPCACCGREIKDTAKAIPVTVDWNNWLAIEGHNNNHLFEKQHREIHNDYFGSACWRKLK